MEEIRLKVLNNDLLPSAAAIANHLLPGGDVIVKKKEYRAGGLMGLPGDGFRLSLETGSWFTSEGETGNNIISLWARCKNITIDEAYEFLDKEKMNPKRAWDTGFIIHNPRPLERTIAMSAPAGVSGSMRHKILGPPTSWWKYMNANMTSAFWVAEYDTPNGKQLRQWVYEEHAQNIVCREYPYDRPLYDLPRLIVEPDKKVVLVDNEHAAESAKIIIGPRAVVTTWAMGVDGFAYADWGALKERKVIIWPSADATGMSTARKIAKILHGMQCDVKIIIPDRNSGWNAADALREKWDTDAFTKWASVRAQKYEVSVTIDDGNSPRQSSANIALFESWGLDMTKKGDPLNNASNGLRVLRNHPKYDGHVWWDDFHCKYLTDLGGEIRPWTDADTNRLTIWLQMDCGLKTFPELAAFKALDAYCRENARNEPVDWMKTLVWDGIGRIDAFFSWAFGAEDSPYTRAVSSNFWIGMVARAHEPGIKNDNMVILQGRQGAYKSTAIEAIGGKWYTELSQTAGTVDFYHALQGKLLVEISELASFAKADGEHIKTALSRKTDRMRIPYGRIPEDFKRGCVFMGTTNKKVYLKDNTGNRRYWPIRCHAIDVEDIKKNRDQMFAEAVTRFKDGETWHKIPMELAEAHQNSVRRNDPWEGAIGKYLMNKNETTSSELITDAIKMSLDKADSRVQARIDNIMELFEWDVEVSQFQRGQMVWRRPGTKGLFNG